jgi:hypothetical protein
MSDQEYRTQEFRDLGFRCLEPTAVTLQDGTQVTVKADTYRKSFERPDDTLRQRRALRFYTLTDSGGCVELIDEISLEERLGADAFNQLPA